MFFFSSNQPLNLHQKSPLPFLVLTITSVQIIDPDTPRDSRDVVSIDFTGFSYKT